MNWSMGEHLFLVQSVVLFQEWLNTQQDLAASLVGPGGSLWQEVSVDARGQEGVHLLQQRLALLLQGLTLLLQSQEGLLPGQGTGGEEASHGRFVTTFSPGFFW